MTDEKCRFQRVNGVWLFTDYQSYTRNLVRLGAAAQSRRVASTCWKRAAVIPLLRVPQAQLLSQAEAKVLSKPAGQEPQAP